MRAPFLGLRNRNEHCPKQPVENLLKGKSGASSRGNSSFSSVY